ncbi:hypothetical protein V493_01515 [Pseudogymnoascus sp. VKM F-4281 (FW-2241)]|nr:hypothetical protein V493_01515 [Pseudogymnoascus sp. VKM F-4281 (FW-2241)]
MHCWYESSAVVSYSVCVIETFDVIFHLDKYSTDLTRLLVSGFVRFPTAVDTASIDSPLPLFGPAAKLSPTHRRAITDALDQQ